MAKLLPKGAKVPVASKKVELRLKWDESKDATDTMDVDGFVMGRGADGKIAYLTGLSGHPLEDGGKTPAISGYFIAPGNEFGGKNPFAWIEPAKDERTGAAAGWDEVTKLQLDKVPPEVVRLDVLVTIYPLKDDGVTPNGHTMAMIENCAVELAGEDGKPLVSADAKFLDPKMWGISGVWFCSMVRESDGKWGFQNVMVSDPTITYYNDWMETVFATIPASNV